MISILYDLGDSYFQISDLSTGVRLNFRRPHLKHWQKIQQQAEQHIRSWVVKTKPND